MPVETWQVRWLRRAATLPSLAALTLFAVALLPLALLLAGLAELVLRAFGRTRLALCRTLCFLTFFLLCESGGVLAALWIWLFRRRDPERFVLANVRMQAAWCRLLLRAGQRIFSLHVRLHGELPPTDRPLLLFVRHCSTVDTVLPVALFTGPRELSPRYVLKRELLLDPCIDIVGSRMRNSFVRRGAETASEVTQMLSLLEDLSPRDCIVIYPEGTRFTPRKREQLLTKLTGQTLHLAQQLQYTLPPLRTGALALLEKNPGADLVLLGHTGLEAAGSLKELLGGSLIGATLDVWLRHVPFAQLPTTEAERRALLSRLWLELDAQIAAHREVALRRAA